MAKLRKQISIETLDYVTTTLNDLLSTNMPQSSKRRICLILERLLVETKNYKGYKYLYYSKCGHEEWTNHKSTLTNPPHVIPEEFLYGPDCGNDMNFVSDTQGKFSRRYL
jgi:hypothetical protein